MPASPIEIRRLRVGDLAAACDLLLATFGNCFGGEDYLRATVRTYGRGSRVGFGAFQDGVLKGVGTTGVADRACIADGKRHDQAGAFDWSSVAWLECVAVAPDARRQGLGHRLIRHRLDHLRARGRTTAIAASWVNGTDETSAGPLHAAGFSQLAVVEDYWYDTSATSGAECICGSPCRCTAILMACDLRV